MGERPVAGMAYRLARTLSVGITALLVLAPTAPVWGDPSWAARPDEPGSTEGRSSAGEDPFVTLHPPIVVVGDEGPSGFTLGHHPLTQEPIYRPGSGVVGGSGARDDPYVISGWSTPSIRLNGTTAHVTIEGNAVESLESDTTERHGIHLEDARNVHVKENTVHEATSCIGILQSRDVHIERNEVSVCHERGILVRGSHGVLIERNTVDTGTKAIELSHSKDVQVRENGLRDVHTAFYGIHGDEVDLERNRIASFARGIQFVSSQNVTVRSHVIESLDVAGILLWQTDHATTTDNVLRDMPIGIDIRNGAHHLYQDNQIEMNQKAVVISNEQETTQSEGPADDVIAWLDALLNGQQWETVSGEGGHVFLDNEIRNNNEGGLVFLTDTPGVRLEGNNIHENGVGLDNGGNTDEVDARGNWWGCSGGPGSPGCDTVAGPVHTDPALTRENPEAGA